MFGFNQWKPTLKQAFDKVFTHKQFIRLFRDLNFDRFAAPKDLSFKQWFGLFNYFISNVDKEKQQIVFGVFSKLKKQQVKLRKIHKTRLK